MSKKVTIRVPTEKGNTRYVEGHVYILTLGGKKLRVVQHDDVMTDFRSGYKIASIRAVQIEHMARLSMYHRITPRKACQLTLDRIAERIGDDVVWEKIMAAPSLNYVNASGVDGYVTANSKED